MESGGKLTQYISLMHNIKFVYTVPHIFVFVNVFFMSLQFIYAS